MVLWCSWDHYFIKQSFLKHGCNTKSSWHFLYPRLHLQSFKQANFCTRMRTEVRGKKGCGWRWAKIWLQTKLSSFFILSMMIQSAHVELLLLYLYYKDPVNVTAHVHTSGIWFMQHNTPFMKTISNSLTITKSLKSLSAKYSYTIKS